MRFRVGNGHTTESSSIEWGRGRSGISEKMLRFIQFRNIKLHGFIQKTEKKSYQGISPKTKIQKLKTTNLKFCVPGIRLDLDAEFHLEFVFHHSCSELVFENKDISRCGPSNHCNFHK